jgi:hypothetical protein
MQTNQTKKEIVQKIQAESFPAYKNYEIKRLAEIVKV